MWRCGARPAPGLEGDLVDIGGPAARPAHKVVTDLVHLLEPQLKACGDLYTVADLAAQTLAEGSSAFRQRRVLRRRGRLTTSSTNSSPTPPADYGDRTAPRTFSGDGDHERCGASCHRRLRCRLNNRWQFAALTQPVKFGLANTSTNSASRLPPFSPGYNHCGNTVCHQSQRPRGPDEEAFANGRCRDHGRDAARFYRARRRCCSIRICR